MNKFDLTTAKGRAEWKKASKKLGLNEPLRLNPRFNPLMAYLDARNGKPEWLCKLLRDAGFDELADDIEDGEVKFKVLSEEDVALIYATIEFRRLGLRAKDKAVRDEFAVARGIGVTEFHGMAIQEGGRYQRLKKYLPEDLFPYIEPQRGKKKPRP